MTMRGDHEGLFYTWKRLNEAERIKRLQEMAAGVPPSQWTQPNFQGEWRGRPWLSHDPIPPPLSNREQELPMPDKPWPSPGLAAGGGGPAPSGGGIPAPMSVPSLKPPMAAPPPAAAIARVLKGEPAPIQRPSMPMQNAAPMGGRRGG